MTGLAAAALIGAVAALALKRSTEARDSKEGR